jgi:hypothetical protein
LKDSVGNDYKLSMQQMPKERPKAEDEEPWSDDQEKREYYYDDAYGYEVFEPEAEENDENDGEPADANRSK